MTAPQQPNPTPSEPQSPSEPTASAPAIGTSPWTAPPSAPEWAKGKTADEILALATQMAQVIQQPVASPPTTPAGNGNGSNGGLPSNDQWITEPNKAAAAVAQQTLDPIEKGLRDLTGMFATTQRALAAQQYKSDFDRYGPEIDGHMSRVPPEQRTLDNYDKVVKYVRGVHLDEIAAERAKAFAAQGAVGERSAGSGGMQIPSNPNGFDTAKLGAFGEMCQRHGINEAAVKDFCSKTGMTVEDWMKNAQGGKLFTNVTPFEATMSESALGIKRRFDE